MIQLLDDRISCILTADNLKPEYRDTPLKLITLDMMIAVPPQPGVIFHFDTRGPAKVLRHEQGVKSFTGKIFEDIGQAAVAIHDTWRYTARINT